MGLDTARFGGAGRRINMRYFIWGIVGGLLIVGLFPPEENTAEQAEATHIQANPNRQSLEELEYFAQQQWEYSQSEKQEGVNNESLRPNHP